MTKKEEESIREMGTASFHLRKNYARQERESKIRVGGLV